MAIDLARQTRPGKLELIYNRSAAADWDNW
jgi:hypothetical protein